MQKPILIPAKTENDVAVDSVFCPHCGGEMLRYKMDNPYTIYGRHYVCYTCGAEEFISPEIEELEECV